jgi:hypothetical protein
MYRQPLNSDHVRAQDKRYLVIHHTNGPLDESVMELKSRYISNHPRSWPRYHYLIYNTGRYVQLAPVRAVLYASNRAYESVHIAFVGDYDKHYPSPFALDTFRIVFLHGIPLFYYGVKVVVPHSFFPDLAEMEHDVCPGRKLVAALLEEGLMTE